MTPQTLTLKRLHKQGYLPWVVEAWQPYTNKRLDLYGILDVVAVPGPKRCGPLLGVQTTTKGGFSARKRKIEGSPYARFLLRAGVELELQGWFKGPGGRWEARIGRFDLTRDTQVSMRDAS